MSVAEPPANILGLRALADLYEATLKVRNACANRLRALEQGADDDPGARPVANYPLLDQLNRALEVATSAMESELPKHPVYEWLMGVPGINRILGCRILGLIPMESEEDFSTFSKLRVFAGLCPGRNKLKKNEKAPFSKRLKTVLYIAFGNMLKAAPLCENKPNSPAVLYAVIYRKWRSIYLGRYGDGPCSKKEGNDFTRALDEAQQWSDLRQHYAAKNKLLDVFLCHIWREWREALGWSVRSLYVHEILEHDMNYQSKAFSSPAMATKKIKQHRNNGQ